MKMRYVFSVILITALGLIPSKMVLACSCLPLTVENAYEGSDLIFAGRVLESSVVVDGGSSKGDVEVFWHEIDILFAVRTTYKGDSRPFSVVLRTPVDSAACGYNFEVGKNYLVYAYAEDGLFRTNLCTRTAPLDSEFAQNDIEAMQAIGL